ncbi:ATP-binding protein [Candidatus Woesearchaeota archaeon]|nr:ATP-binding protein [Candidatus Woesearchaeota archaeon]
MLNDALETICSFLNHRGGTVYFGVKDKDGKVIGTTFRGSLHRKYCYCYPIQPQNRIT